MLTLRAQFVGLVFSVECEARAPQQRGGLGGVGVQTHAAKTVVGLTQMRLGRGGIVHDQLDDAGKLLDLEKGMTQAEFGDRAPGRVDHPSGGGGAAAERLQHGLAARRCRFDRRRVGRDSQQPHHVKTPPARARNRIGSPQRREWRIGQHRVHPAVFARAPRRGERVVQGDFAVADSPEAAEATGTDGVRLGFSGGVAQFSQLCGGRAHRGLDLIQPVRMDQHRQFAVEARRPCGETVGTAGRFLQLRHRARRRRHVTGGQQSLAARDQERGDLLVAVGQLVVDLLQRMQGPVVEVGGAFVGQPGHRLVCGTTAVLDGLGRVSRPRTFEVVVGEFGEQLVVGAGLVFQRRGDALMQPHAPHRRQLGEQRLTHQGVVEAVATAGLFDHDAGLARLVERVDEIVPDHVLDQFQGEPAADDRGRRKRLVRLRRKPRQPAAHRFTHPLRQGARIPLAATLVHMAQGLDQKERVATGD